MEAGAGAAAVAAAARAVPGKSAWVQSAPAPAEVVHQRPAPGSPEHVHCWELARLGAERRRDERCARSMDPHQSSATASNLARDERDAAAGSRAHRWCAVLQTPGDVVALDPTRTVLAVRTARDAEAPLPPPRTAHTAAVAEVVAVVAVPVGRAVGVAGAEDVAHAVKWWKNSGDA